MATVHEDGSARESGVLYRLYKGNFINELKSTVSLASGLMVTNLSAMVLATMPTLFLGHVGQSELSAAAFINVAFTVACEPVVLGLASACDTYFAQAYGIGEKLYVGVLLQRAFAIVFLVCAFIAAIFINVGNILVLIKMDPKIAGVIIALLGIVIGASVDYVLIFQLNMSVVGAAIGQNCAYLAMASASTVYICITPKLHNATWAGWSFEMLSDWGPFFFLGVKGTMLFCVEYWLWVIIILAAGYLGNVELGSQEILFNIEVIFVTLGLGVGDATAIRVGQELGAGNVDSAVVASRVSYTFVGFVACALSIILGALRSVIPLLYTDIPSVLHLTIKYMPLLAYMIFADNLTYTGIGVFRGVGFQGYGFMIIAVAYYVIALPICLSLMFSTDLRSYGAWIGASVGLTVASSTYFVVSHFIIDWSKAADMAKERITDSYDVKNNELISATFKENSALLSGGRHISRSLDEDQTERDLRKRNLLKKRILICACVALILSASILIRRHSDERQLGCREREWTAVRLLIILTSTPQQYLGVFSRLRETDTVRNRARTGGAKVTNWRQDRAIWIPDLRNRFLTSTASSPWKLGFNVA
ncbi:hypothetical protein CAPTEDRAFT_217910 [Capitella teleta]|uniref:Multidrug and toxin extrusion protein n=1 Tax=Capitella teleta TaxID=283909 RepID=R7V497_CAPTE|nr:hypothetical protein CAPTEDRAFT_217910 [Capitella teleta]|eukprot:ELU13282.1 hypothetical protein CAPTEDRAFT_217910 [Capitella teleta]